MIGGKWLIILGRLYGRPNRLSRCESKQIRELISAWEGSELRRTSRAEYLSRAWLERGSSYSETGPTDMPAICCQRMLSRGRRGTVPAALLRCYTLTPAPEGSIK